MTVLKPESASDAATVLRRVFLVDKYYDELSEIDLYSTFRLKHTGLGRGPLREMIHAGVVQDSGREMGACVDWAVSEEGREAMALVRDDEIRDALVLDESALELVERYPRLILFELPSDLEIEFKSQEYGVARRTIGALREAGLVEVADEPSRGPYVWSITEKTRLIQEFANGGEQ